MAISKYIIPDLKHITKVLRVPVATKDNTEYCSTCDVLLGYHINEYTLCCPICKHVVNIAPSGESNITKWESSNVAGNGCSAFKPVVGHYSKNRFTCGSYTITAVYDKSRMPNILERLSKKNYMNNNFQLPNNVLKEVARIYAVEVQDAILSYNLARGVNKKYIRRGMSLNGILGGLIMIVSTEYGCSKTKTQIAHMMQIDESKITAGIKELKGMVKDGIINGIRFDEDPISDYIEGYFQDFDIDLKYKTFVCELVHRIYKKNITSITSKFTTTVCLGCVYLLMILTNTNKQPSDVIHKFYKNVTSNTYRQVYKNILANKKALRKPFIRRGIPLPAEWC